MPPSLCGARVCVLTVPQPRPPSPRQAFAKEDRAAGKNKKEATPASAPKSTTTTTRSSGSLPSSHTSLPMNATTAADVTVQAHLWLDSTCLGHVGTTAIGKDDPENPTTAGRQGKQVPSCHTQQLHAEHYAAIDRTGKGALEHGQTFHVVPWHRHVIQAVENINSYATWLTARCLINSEKLAIWGHMSGVERAAVKKADNVDLPEEHLLQPHTKDSMSITPRKNFTLAMTRDVVCRATNNIIEAKEWDVRPTRAVPASPKHPHTPPPRRTKSGSLSPFLASPARSPGRPPATPVKCKIDEEHQANVRTPHSREQRQLALNAKARAKARRCATTASKRGRRPKKSRWCPATACEKGSGAMPRCVQQAVAGGAGRGGEQDVLG